MKNSTAGSLILDKNYVPQSFEQICIRIVQDRSHPKD
jgi:hypothetical protein